MPVRHLDEQRASALRAAPLSYDPADLADTASAKGFGTLTISTRLARRDFEAAERDLLEWWMHSRAGLRVGASDIPLRPGTVVLMRWGPGPLSVPIPCRVVTVIDEPRRRGFTYGTLPGHPEAGEESFVLEHLDDGSVRFVITARSRPASTPARLVGPIAGAAQRFMTQRYPRALDRLPAKAAG